MQVILLNQNRSKTENSESICIRSTTSI